MVNCNSKVLCNDENCKECYEKSFASHEKSNYILDNKINNPRNIFKCCNKKFEFECNNCNHIFDCKISNITTNNRWCPYCANKKICDNENCDLCFKKSFASHEKSEYIVDKIKNNPRYIFKGSEKIIEFKCHECNHNFESMIGNITLHNTWCSYCANKKICDDENCDLCYEKSFASHKKSIYWSNENCNSCYEKSFASHEKSKFWSKKNVEIPRNIFKGSHTKYWFDCKDCKSSFYSSINQITGRNTWCPKCMFKTQKILFKFLNKNYTNIIPEFKDDWTKSIELNSDKYYRFDFLLKNYNIIIELDGEQHFSQVSSWKSPEETANIDIYKMNKAIENNYSVIRILQEDVFNNKNNWNTKLIENIKMYDKPTIIYIDNEKNKYLNHRNKMN